MTILEHPRKPVYKGTESIKWSEVDKSFDAFVAEYYKHHTKPHHLPTMFKEADLPLRNWISAHSLLGNPEATKFKYGLCLPIVNTVTGKLNKNGLYLAKIFVSKVNNISDKQVRETKAMIQELYEKEFKPTDARETLQAVVDILKQYNSSDGVIELIKEDPYLDYLLENVPNNEVVLKLESLLK